MRRVVWRFTPQITAVWTRENTRKMRIFAVISATNTWATNGSVLSLPAVFLFLNYGFVFTDVGMAWEIFSLRFLRQVVNDNILPLQAFANGSKRAPRAGAADLAKRAVSFMRPATWR